MAENQIQSVSHKHEAILQFMIANPTVALRDVAVHFRVTQAWLSTVIHSDAFQDKLQERQNEVFGVLAAGIKERLTTVAVVGLEKVVDFVERSDDKDYVTNTTMSVLERLGYSPKAQQAPAGPSVQNNFFNVTKDDLRSAKGAIFDKAKQVAEDAVNVTDVAALPAPSAGGV